MRVSTRKEDWLTILGVAGELDAATAPRLREQLEQCLSGGCRWLLVDLHDLEYIDSTGLGLLIGAAKLLAEAGGDLTIACPRPNVMRVFEISGTGSLLHVKTEEVQARCYLAERRGVGAQSPAGEGDECHE